MFRNKTILAPTDFNKRAKTAHKYALEVASRSKSRLHLLHAVEEPYDFATRVEEVVEAASEVAQEKFEQMIRTVRKREEYRGLPIEFQIKRGMPYSTIMETARDINADLIIMGTKGESSIKRILFGDITSNVILDSGIPVLTVPENSKKPYLDRIIFATDYRESDLDSLKQTVELARTFEAEIRVLHVDENTSIDSQIRFRGFREMACETIDFPEIQFEKIEAERFTKGISEYVTDNPISLIVLTRYKKRFLKTLLWANNTQELTYYTHVPMLVMTP